MERSKFIVAAAGLGAFVTAAGASRAASPVAAVATPFPGYSAAPGSPYPYPHSQPHPMWTRGEYRSNRDLRHVLHHVERLIDELQHDTHDYCGHRTQAIGYLQQARDQLQAGLACDEQH